MTARTAAALFLVLAWPAPAAGAIRKGPWLAALGPTGVTVRVELDGASPARVELSRTTGGTAAGPDISLVVTAPAAELHAVRADGLSPATTYDYRFVADDGSVARGRFTTAPSDGRPFRFIVYGDNRSDRDAHAAVVRAIASAPSDFLLHTGDMVAAGGRAEDWQGFFDVERDLLRERCVFAAVGNHELHGDGNGERFLRYFGTVAEPPGGAGPSGLYASFRWSNTRFFLLNAMDELDGAAEDWLRDELERSRAEAGVAHRIAVLHHGPYSSGPHGPNPRLVAADVVDLLVRGGVDLLLAGHDHVYERGEGRGLKYVISGGGGAPLYARKTNASETAAFESVHHFVDIAVDGERIDIEARRASGSVIERCGFGRGGGWSCSAAAAATVTPAGAAAATASASHAGDAARSTGGASATSCLCRAGAPSTGQGACALALAAGAAAALSARRRRRCPSRLARWLRW